MRYDGHRKRPGGAWKPADKPKRLRTCLQLTRIAHGMPLFTPTRACPDQPQRPGARAVHVTDTGERCKPSQPCFKPWFRAPGPGGRSPGLAGESSTEAGESSTEVSGQCLRDFFW